MSTTARNLHDPNVTVVFSHDDPRLAAISAHAIDQGNGNSWEWEEKYGSLVQKGKYHYFCGDWGVRIPRPKTSVKTERENTP